MESWRLTRSRRRGTTELIVSVLKACVNVSNITNIAHTANINWIVYEPMMNPLIKAGYLKKISNPEHFKHPLAVYETTAKGLIVINVVEELLRGF